MRSLEAEAKGRHELLEELYNSLERDWNAYKQSESRSWRRVCCTDSDITVKAIQLLHNSPRHLMSQLQGSTTTEITGDGSKLKRRRLFEDMEGQEGDEMGQVVRTLSFCYSEDEADGCKGSPHSSSSSSSSPFVSGEEQAKVKGTKDSVYVGTDAERRSEINGGRYIVMLGGFGIALLMFAICCMRSATSYGGFEGILVPT